ncbi:hypothetical protein LCGC14_1371600 [marine sediment metagenome]|uniref:Uncharacterized protein n=1 Tax=marine sediment metagenome TaxID=412755 RepID=A0A0F9K5L2_9ZZZZ
MNACRFSFNELFFNFREPERHQLFWFPGCSKRGEKEMTVKILYPAEFKKYCRLFAEDKATLGLLEEYLSNPEKLQTLKGEEPKEAKK